MADQETAAPETKDSLPSLGELILEMLISDPNTTDVHVASGQALRVRKASYDWQTPCGVDGKPIVIDHLQIVALINGIYEDEETPYLFVKDSYGNDVLNANKQPQVKKPKWIDELRVSKSLHPSYDLASVKPVEGGEPTVISQRVRFTIQRQDMGRGIGIMARGLGSAPESIRSLGLPIQVEKLADQNTAGLIVVTGPTGSGKSTTIAAILAKYNAERTANIVTLEDPVEIVHVPNKSFFAQREIGVDVASFEAGVVDAMRFALDILVIGEVRTADTMKAAMRAANSGHLVIVSMHSPNAVSAIRKMLSFLDNGSDAVSLSSSLIGVIAQALVSDANSKNKKHLACEVLFTDSKEVQEAVADGGAVKLAALDAKLSAGAMGGSCLAMKASLLQLIKEQKIDPRRAAAIVQGADERAELLALARAATQRPNVK